MPPKIIYFFVFLLTSNCSYGYVINVLESFKGTQFAENTERFLTSVYSPLGIKPEFVYYPSKRGLNLVDSGKIDAEALRINIVGDRFENLIRVKVVLGNIPVGFFCLAEELCNVNATSSIAVLSGFEGAEELCSKLGLKCQYVREPFAVVKMLQNGLVDAYFATTTAGVHVVCASESETIFFAQRKDLNLDVYHYINRKHIELKQALEQAITRSKLEGLYPNNESVEQQTSYGCKTTVKIL